MANYEDIAIEIEDILQSKINNSEYRKKIEELSQQHKESLYNKNKNLKEQITGEIISMGLFVNLDYNKIEKLVESVVKQELSLENIPIVKQNIIKAAMLEEERITKEKERVKSNKKKKSI